VIPDDVMADIIEVAKAVALGTPVDPEVKRRVRERSSQAKRELEQRFGVREIAVRLIREGRN
jgi:hypothetical protein